MMKTKKILVVLTCLSVFCFFFAGLASSQEIPKPGTVIDKNNYKKYAHLFPPEYLDAFENGWGLISPISIKVSEKKYRPLPRAYLALSEKNKGKFQIDANGAIVGTYERGGGFPFPDLKDGDSKFVEKLMWNFDARYFCDDSQQVAMTFQVRKGEKTRMSGGAFSEMLYLNGRSTLNPKPKMVTPEGYFRMTIMAFYAPESMKNTAMMDYRFLDTKKLDVNFLYSPSVRRVLRGDSSQRSTPVAGQMSSRDDFGAFDGQVPQFTYRYLGMKKLLACYENTKNLPYYKKKYGGDASKMDKIEFPGDNWEVRDHYVVEIKSKDPRYPQSKKVLYFDKENFSGNWVVVWDRAGNLWKMWAAINVWDPVGDGIDHVYYGQTLGVDVQFGMADYMLFDVAKTNAMNYTTDHFTPTALIKRGK